MDIAITQVDAFTNKPFAGNPAAVCILTEQSNDSWMQSVAQEMNLAETSFLVPRYDRFDLRWFAPTTEVALCGHGTLASAHVLWEEGRLDANQHARFETRSGIITAEKRRDWIEMDFPATPAGRLASTDDLESALKVKPRYIGRSRFDYLIEVDSEDEVRSLQPDFSLVSRLSARGVIVTSRSSVPEYDFVSRFFVVASGVGEDPVTGSAHCCLGPFWKDRLGRDELVGYQASARGGVVRTRCGGDRVYLSGQAVTVLRGKLTSD